MKEKIDMNIFNLMEHHVWISLCSLFAIRHEDEGIYK